MISLVDRINKNKRPYFNSYIADYIPADFGTFGTIFSLYSEEGGKVNEVRFPNIIVNSGNDIILVYKIVVDGEILFYLEMEYCQGESKSNYSVPSVTIVNQHSAVVYNGYSSVPLDSIGSLSSNACPYPSDRLTISKVGSNYSGSDNKLFLMQDSIIFNKSFEVVLETSYAPGISFNTPGSAYNGVVNYTLFD